MLVASQLDIASAVQTVTVDSGDYYLGKVKNGQTVRLVDLEGNQAADTLLFSAIDPTERYSAQDTIRMQQRLYLTVGSILRSSEGKVMAEIVADTCGRHDTVGGACASESNSVRYDLEKRSMHSCRDSWMLAVAEHPELGLSKRSITHNINFFMNVPVTPEGELTFEDGISSPGKYVEFTAKMDLILLISNCPQLNNPCNGFNPTPIDVVIWD